MTIADPDLCTPSPTGRRRIFWVTQPRACGEYTMCGHTCAIPGLEYQDSEDGRTINNDGWLLGLILNILNTRARTDRPCPAPTAIFGHWSESYRKDNLYLGSQLWNAAAKAYIRTADMVRAIEAAVKADMAKLVALQVATSVNVVANYLGRNTVGIVVEAVVGQNKHVLNLSGAFVSGAWVWQS